MKKILAGLLLFLFSIPALAGGKYVYLLIRNDLPNAKKVLWLHEIERAIGDASGVLSATNKAQAKAIWNTLNQRRAEANTNIWVTFLSVNYEKPNSKRPPLTITGQQFRNRAAIVLGAHSNYVDYVRGDTTRVLTNVLVMPEYN